MYVRLVIQLTQHDPHHDWIASRVKELLAEDDDSETFPTVAELVESSQFASDALVSASLRTAQKRVGLI